MITYNAMKDTQLSRAAASSFKRLSFDIKNPLHVMPLMSKYLVDVNYNNLEHKWYATKMVSIGAQKQVILGWGDCPLRAITICCLKVSDLIDAHDADV